MNTKHKKIVIKNAIRIIKNEEEVFSCYAVARCAEALDLLLEKITDDNIGDNLILEYLPRVATSDELNVKWLYNKDAVFEGYRMSIEHLLDTHTSDAIFIDSFDSPDYERDLRIKLLNNYLNQL